MVGMELGCDFFPNGWVVGVRGDFYFIFSLHGALVDQQTNA
jgi:hypothetical protein